MKRARDISNWPVMRAQCSTCPFRCDAKGRHADPQLVARIQAQALSEASQLCHHPSLSGKPETHLCRGARNFQLTIFFRLGVIEAPSDAAWEQKRREIERSRWMH
jgi:hypothetical protein